MGWNYIDAPYDANPKTHRSKKNPWRVEKVTDDTSWVWRESGSEFSGGMETKTLAWQLESVMPGGVMMAGIRWLNPFIYYELINGEDIGNHSLKVKNRVQEHIFK